MSFIDAVGVALIPVAYVIANAIDDIRAARHELELAERRAFYARLRRYTAPIRRPVLDVHRLDGTV